MFYVPLSISMGAERKVSYCHYIKFNTCTQRNIDRIVQQILCLSVPTIRLFL